GWPGRQHTDLLQPGGGSGELCTGEPGIATPGRVAPYSVIAQSPQA
nr:hypothetical protein [Tanacetum cinerariifolium]